MMSENNNSIMHNPHKLNQLIDLELRQMQSFIPKVKGGPVLADDLMGKIESSLKMIELFDLLDGIYLATVNAGNETAIHQMKEMISNALGILEEMSIVEIKVIGKRFDSTYMRLAGGNSTGQVAAIYKRGFKLSNTDVLLRPAHVKVMGS